ncbi:MAG: UbiX family flavin prenyltransferase [Phycisphaerae bacterium]
MGKRIVLAITGASGAAYAQRLLQCLVEGGCEVHLIISPYGRRLLAEELAILEPTPKNLVGSAGAESVTTHAYNDVGSRLASGSFLTDGMIICPCSSNTLGEVASGLGGNLISRAAAVHLKEGRKLILVPREMPLSQIELDNMMRISRSGGILCPAAPGFYMMPKTIDDLLDFVAGKLCDLLEVRHDLNTRWKPV